MVMLILFAASLFLFSSAMFFVKPVQWRKLLLFLALANTSYCLFTAWQVVQHAGILTIVGFLYFISELLVILALVIFEFNRSWQPH